MVLLTPQQALRQCDRQVNKRAALLVGNGLTAAAKMKSPTVGLGTETGERVAKLAPLYRTAGGSCGSGGNAQVKDQLGMARSVHQGKFQDSGMLRMLEVTEKFSELRQQIIQRILEMKNGNDKCTPQPDAARAELALFNEMLPWLDLNNGVREAMKK